MAQTFQINPVPNIPVPKRLAALHQFGYTVTPSGQAGCLVGHPRDVNLRTAM